VLSIHRHGMTVIHVGPLPIIVIVFVQVTYLYLYLYLILFNSFNTKKMSDYKRMLMVLIITCYFNCNQGKY
jgi:hypothetical protein